MGGAVEKDTRFNSVEKEYYGNSPKDPTNNTVNKFICLPTNVHIYLVEKCPV